MDSLEDLCSLLKSAIRDEPPIAMKEGNIIRDGYSEEVDTLRSTPSPTEKTGWQSWKNEEREKTGIKNLKIKYNKVFGYYLEVTNSYKDHCAGLLYKKADAGQCGTLYYYRSSKSWRTRYSERRTSCMHWNTSFTAACAAPIAGEVERIQKTAKAVAGAGRVCIPCPDCRTQ